MSLINDALKRAKQTQPSAAAPGQPAGNTPMHPVDYQRRGLPWYFFPTLLAVLAGACWFLVKGWDARRHAAAGYGEPLVVQAREPVAATPAAAPSGETRHIPAVNDAPPASFTGVNRNFSLEDDNTASAEPTTLAPTPAATATASVAPTFKLQGIFFRATSPSAMINGKSVFVGDRVSGAQVKAIARDSITLEYEGQTKTLTIE